MKRILLIAILVLSLLIAFGACEFEEEEHEGRRFDRDRSGERYERERSPEPQSQQVP